MKLTLADVERTRLLLLALAEFEDVEKQLCKVGKPPSHRGDFWGAGFSFGAFSEDGGDVDTGFEVDQETARLIWPAIRAVIEAEIEKLGAAS